MTERDSHGMLRCGCKGDVCLGHADEESPSQAAARKAALAIAELEQDADETEEWIDIEEMKAIILSAIQSVLQPWVEATGPFVKPLRGYTHSPDNLLVSSKWDSITVGDLRRIAELVERGKGK